MQGSYMLAAQRGFLPRYGVLLRWRGYLWHFLQACRSMDFIRECCATTDLVIVYEDDFRTEEI